MTLGQELRALDATNNSGLWLMIRTPSIELRALDAMKSLRLSMT